MTWPMRRRPGPGGRGRSLHTCPGGLPREGEGGLREPGASAAPGRPKERHPGSAPGSRPWDLQQADGARTPRRSCRLRARRPSLFPERARRGRAGAAGARGRHPVRQRLAPAAWPGRARLLLSSRVPVFDDPAEDLLAHLEPTCAAMEAAVHAGGACLVYRKNGRSRSAAVCTAYLMRHRGLSLERAWAGTGLPAGRAGSFRERRAPPPGERLPGGAGRLWTPAGALHRGLPATSSSQTVKSARPVAGAQPGLRSQLQKYEEALQSRSLLPKELSGLKVSPKRSALRTTSQPQSRTLGGLPASSGWEGVVHALDGRLGHPLLPHVPRSFHFLQLPKALCPRLMVV